MIRYYRRCLSVSNEPHSPGVVGFDCPCPGTPVWIAGWP